MTTSNRPEIKVDRHENNSKLEATANENPNSNEDKQKKWYNHAWDGLSYVGKTGRSIINNPKVRKTSKDIINKIKENKALAGSAVVTGLLDIGGRASRKLGSIGIDVAALPLYLAATAGATISLSKKRAIPYTLLALSTTPDIYSLATGDVKNAALGLGAKTAIAGLAYTTLKLPKYIKESFVEWKNKRKEAKKK